MQEPGVEESPVGLHPWLQGLGRVSHPWSQSPVREAKQDRAEWAFRDKPVLLTTGGRHINEGLVNLMGTRRDEPRDYQCTLYLVKVSTVWPHISL